MAANAPIHGATRTPDELPAPVSLTTDELDTGEARDRWSDTLNQLYCEMDIAWPRGHRSFTAQWAGQQVGDLHVSAIRAEMHTVLRSPAMVASDWNEDLLVCMVDDGHARISQGGRTAVLSHGAIGVLDCSKPFSYHCPEQFRQVVVRMPRALLTSRLPSDVVDETSARAIPGNRGVGKLLAGVLNGMAALGNSVSTGAAAVLSGSALDIVALVVTETTPPTSATAAAHARDLFAAQQALRRHLHEAGYSLGDLSTELGMSVRYIQELFANVGTTPRTWLQQIRIERARRHLLTTRLTVAEVAARSGFRDVSHFSRTFRARLGMSPGSYRAAPQTRHTESADVVRNRVTGQ